MKNLFAYLVCIGVNVNTSLLEEILKKQNPYEQKRGGLGFGLHGTVMLKNQTPRGVNIRINSNSPLRLFKVQEKDRAYEIFKDGEFIAGVRLFEPPEWMHTTLSSGKPVALVLQQHTGKNLVGIIGTTRCPLFDSGNTCSFCQMSGGKDNSDRSVEEIIEALSIILHYKSDYVLTFTAPFFRNDQEFADACESLRKIKGVFSNIPLAFESQPVSKKMIDLVKDVGVDTFMIPLDCYSTEAQLLHLPGKQQILRDFYWDSLPYAVSVFGEGNVIGNIIVGMEEEFYTRVALQEMIQIGVIPDLIPIRPSLSFRKETNPEIFESVQKYLREQMHFSGLASRMSKVKSGCAACGGCSAGFTTNMLKNELKN